MHTSLIRRTVQAPSADSFVALPSRWTPRYKPPPHFSPNEKWPVAEHDFDQRARDHQRMHPRLSAASRQHIPSLLTAQPRWCRWHRTASGKTPLGSTLKSTTMRPWSEVERLPRTADSGIGFVMTGGVQLGVGRLYALDLDACVHPGTGVIEDWALQVLNTCGLSYTEITPSGTGLRIWVIVQRSPIHWGNKVFTPPKAVAPEGVTKRPELQVYGTGAANYVTVTGAQLIGTSNEILTIENMEWITDQFGGSLLGRSDETPAWLRKLEEDALDPLEHAHDLRRAEYVLQNVFPDPDALGYWPWFRLTAALASLGQQGRELARRWSAAGKKYNPLTDCTDERFDGLNGTIHIATLFAAADEAAPGWRNGFAEDAAAGESPAFEPLAAEPISSLFDPEDLVDPIWSTPDWLSRPLESVLTTPAEPWLIDGYIRKKQTGFLVAFSTVGKSTLAAAWLMHVAYGADWCGRVVAKGPVVALIGENLAGFARSADAYARHHQFSGTRATVDLVDFKLPLSSPKGHAGIKAYVDGWVARKGYPPALIIIDTLSSHWAESEDASEFAAPAMRTLGDLAARWGCAVLIVHHITKGPGAKVLPELRDIRGSSAFFSNTDFTFAMAAPEKGAVLLAGLKTKSDALPPTLRLTRSVVDCGLDANGGASTAAVLENVAEIVTEAADEAVKGPLGVAKDVEQEIWALVSVVAKLGSAQKVDGVVAAAGLRLHRGRAAFSLALDHGLLVAEGRGPTTRYTVTEKGAAGCVFPPVEEPGTGGEPGSV